jgi:molybdopterin-containing oxidoreductase family iron-sulfur binding subunit
MERSRRGFLKISGACLLGMIAGPAIGSIATGGERRYQPNPEALSAGRWTMLIDTRKCKVDCTDCMDVCHKIHNVPDIGNSKQEVKWLWQETYEHGFPGAEHEFISENLKHRPLMMLCNHCDNPPCARVCPVGATWKREDGIVMMDYHRCIGCRCCMAACPYGSRSFNWSDPRQHLVETNPSFPTRSKGVAEKCNFCAERLAIGLVPACVESCKEKALFFGDLDDDESEIRQIIRSEFAIQRKPELGTKPRTFYIL